MVRSRVIKHVVAGLLIGVIGASICFLCYEEWGVGFPLVQSSTPQLSNPRSGYVGSPRIPDTLYFAGERVPLERDDVLESLDRELCVASNWHSQILLMLKRSSRYFPEIDSLLIANGIPRDFKYLAVAESSLNERAISPSRAVGLWQFLEKVGQEYGLQIDDEVDQRYDIACATAAACRYLQGAYQRFGSWFMAAAAYNMGNNGLQRVVGLQGATNYFDLHLNIETSRYVYRILALKLVLEHPEEYGFQVPNSERYAPYAYRKLFIDSTINNLALFAQAHGVTYKQLRRLNPWLRGYKLSGGKYTLRMPAKP